jgi:hypothetical protein
MDRCEHYGILVRLRCGSQITIFRKLSWSPLARNEKLEMENPNVGVKLLGSVGNLSLFRDIITLEEGCLLVGLRPSFSASEEWEVGISISEKWSSVGQTAVFGRDYNRPKRVTVGNKVIS